MEHQENAQSNLPPNPQEVMKKFPKGPNKKNIQIILVSLLVVIGGVVVGWYLSGEKLNSKSNTENTQTAKQFQEGDVEAGLTDTSSFDPESPEGILVEGGIEGEGTYHLERAGGSSQNVYLTSTVIDLQSFVGKKVKVWGNTLSAVHAGWLMDIGKIKVI